MNRFTGTMRAVAVGAFLATTLVFTACGGDDDDTVATQPPAPPPASGGTATAASPVTVKLGDSTFTPADVKVAKGGKVTWDWGTSALPHSVIGTSANAKDLLKSEQKTGGNFKYEATFANAGTYEYNCGVHGVAMSGKVVVE